MSRQSFLVPLVGEAVSRPIVRVQPTVQRATPLATVGWKYRRRYTVVNGCTEPLINFPFAIDIGLTNGLVTSKALASGNDVRVWTQGQEIARTLTNWNDASFTTLVWVRIPYLGPGESQLYEVVYGNSAAGAPPTLTSGVDAPAFDVATAGTNRSTNAKWAASFAAGKGGWWLSSGSVQPQSSFVVPGAWGPDLTRPSWDDMRQEPFSLISGSYYARFSARRARLGSLTMTADLGADGVSIHHPAGITSVRCDLKYQNMQISDSDTTPIGALEILGRRVQGEPWFSIYENKTLQAAETTIATTTYTPSGGSVYDLAFAVWPYDGLVADPTARDDRYVNGAWNSVLELNIDGTKVTQTTTEAEVEIYELADEVRYGGGGNKSALVPPYNAIRVGNTEQASGAGTPRAACKLNEQCQINAETRTVEIWNSGLTAKVESVPLPAVAAVDGVMQSDGTTREQVATDWLPLRPVVNPLTNPSAVADALSWTRLSSTAGVTASARTRDAATYDSAGGSFTVTISANAAGSGAVVEELANDYLLVGEQRAVWVGMAIRTANVNVQPTPTIWFYDAAQVLIGTSHPMADWTIPAINTWYRRLHAYAVPSGALSYRVGVTAKAKTAGPTGQYWWDSVAVNDAELALYDPSFGTVAVTYAITPRYGHA